jgi:hypothetical protein
LRKLWKLGVIQTSLDPEAAWVGNAKMSCCEEERAITEIRGYFAAFQQEQPRPDIIVLPELAVPTGFETKLKTMANKMQSVVIAGLDYRAGTAPGEVHNEALLIVPKQWRGKKMGAKATTRRIGKPTRSGGGEEAQDGGLRVQARSVSLALFDGGEVGTFGVMVCYDFLDLERIAMYRGKVQHLFILALNKDATSFRHVAEAVSRMVFCNDNLQLRPLRGSQVVCPYRHAERRIIFQHAGAGLATGQIITLPVSRLDLHQHQAYPLFKGERSLRAFRPVTTSEALVQQLAKLG